MADSGDYFGATFDDLDNVIGKIARTVARQHRLDWETNGEDLMQAGWVGAMRAKNRYKPRGFKFLTYAWWFANGEIRRAATRIDKPRHVETPLTHHDPDDPVTTARRQDDHNTFTDPTFDVIVTQLLRSPDGLELLAQELGYRDDTKRGAHIRRQQLDRLRDQWEDAQTP